MTQLSYRPTAKEPTSAALLWFELEAASTGQSEGSAVFLGCLGRAPCSASLLISSWKAAVLSADQKVNNRTLSGIDTTMPISLFFLDFDRDI